MVVDVEVVEGDSDRPASHDRHVRVHRTESLAPPRIVELNSARAVLSWRATRGPCSIRVEEDVQSTDSQEWANLLDDAKYGRRCSRSLTPQIPARRTRVEVFEIEHVELQLCRCGCPQCVRSDGESPGYDKGAPPAGCSCKICKTTGGSLGCWRPAYRGSECWCHVDLEPSNALIYLRLIVRARRPPVDRRGYRRPTYRQSPRAAEDSRGGDTWPKREGCLGGASGLEPSKRRRRRQRQPSSRKQEPGTGVVDGDNSDEGVAKRAAAAGRARVGEATASSILNHTSPDVPNSGYPLGEEINSADRSHERSEAAGGGLPRKTPDTGDASGYHDPGAATATTAHEPTVWFASTSVFVDSRPPTVSIHGIGTALVLTWPPLARLSGLEKVSYMLEQWSGGTGDSNHFSEHARNEGQHRQQQSFRHYGRRNKSCSQSITSQPSQTDNKEVFSVGTRCWFVPASLRKNKRYWYRLRLIHEGGTSLGGAWASHFTSLAPPRCIDVDTRSLSLSLPLAVGDGDGLRRNSVGERHATLAARRKLLFVNEDGGCLRGEGTVSEEPSALGVSNENQHASAREREGGEGDRAEANQHAESPKKVVIWYTLQSLNAESGWNTLYRGPDSEIIVEGLQASTLVTLRVGVDVDMTELRRRSLGSLMTLDLESLPSPPPTAGWQSPTQRSSDPLRRDDDRSDAATTTTTTGAIVSVPAWSREAKSLPSPKVIRAAFRLKPGPSTLPHPVALATTPFVATPASDFFDRRRPWSPSASPIMWQMKEEGFVVHDVAKTVGGGFYPEPPLLSPSAGVGGEIGCDCDATAQHGGGDDMMRGCRDISDSIVIATAPVAPKFASFVTDGNPQVKLWWMEPRDAGALSETCGCDGHLSETTRACKQSSSRHHHKRGSVRKPSMPSSDITATSAAMQVSGQSTSDETTFKRAFSNVDGDDVSDPSKLPHSKQQERTQHCPSFAVDVLDPVTGRMRRVHEGPELYADLRRSLTAANGLPLAAATAYFVTLSSMLDLSQPNSKADSIILTAPPAPVLELAAGRVETQSDVERGEEEDEHGNAEGRSATVLRVFWTMSVDRTFLASREHLPPFSVALEMAHAWESGPPAHGVGCTTRPACRVSSGRAAIASSSQFLTPREVRIAMVAADTPRGEGAAAASVAGCRSARSSSAADVQEVPVRTDASGGQCWTLDSSSWGTPAADGGSRGNGGGFRVVWRGYDGETETFTPVLPPGMRFAFRVRLECCFGVAVSATTVYQTAMAIPIPPKGLLARCATHESRAGKSSRCIRLLWDPPDAGHRKNVVTSYTVQARRYRSCSGAGTQHEDTTATKHKDENVASKGNSEWSHTVATAWADICSCPDTNCLDPESLGETRVVAEYRVRAEGPGGSSRWCNPVRVDVHHDLSSCNDPGKDVSGIEGELVEDVSAGCGNDSRGRGRRRNGERDGSHAYALWEDKNGREEKDRVRTPMAYTRPGTRERDSLTGEIHQRWINGRPPSMSSPTPAVGAADLRPGSATTAAIAMQAAAVAEADHRHRRAGGSRHLLWGALASPRAARGSLVAATTGYGRKGLREGNGGKGVDGIMSAIAEKSGEQVMTGQVIRADTSTSDTQGEEEEGSTHPTVETACPVTADVVVPHALALLLRDQLDVTIGSTYNRAPSSDLGGSDQQPWLRRGSCEGEASTSYGASACADLDTGDGVRRRNPNSPAVRWVCSPCFESACRLHARNQNQAGRRRPHVERGSSKYEINAAKVSLRHRPPGVTVAPRKRRQQQPQPRHHHSGRKRNSHYSSHHRRRLSGPIGPSTGRPHGTGRRGDIGWPYLHRGFMTS